MSRYETLFSLRYAVRILERYARLWQRIDGLLRLFAFLSGTSAIAALVSGSVPWSIAAGIFFAFMQGVEFSIAPARKHADALAARKPYAAILSGQAGFDDAALEAAYQRAVAEDTVIVPEALRPLAYNDAATERGCAPDHLYSLTRWHRFVAFFA